MEADLLAWEEGMEKNKRSEVLGLVLPYLYTYRAKLGCDELSGGAMDAKIRELAGTHAMRVREGRAGKGGDGSAWDAEEGTSSPWGSSSEDGSLVPEDDRTAQWLAGTREGWGVLVDTALLKVLTESAGAVSGAGALGDFCRGPQIAHPAEAFEFLCRRRLAARLLDVLRFAGLHRPALEALHVLATLPDVSARQACVDGDPGPDAGREGAEDDGVPAWDVAGRCAVDAAVEYCCSTPDLARALVEEVCDWVLDVSEEAGLQVHCWGVTSIRRSRKSMGISC